jgi:hypothetical protein
MVQWILPPLVFPGLTICHCCKLLLLSYHWQLLLSKQLSAQLLSLNSTLLVFIFPTHALGH